MRKVVEAIGPFEIVEVEGGYQVPGPYNEGPTFKTLERARAAMNAAVTSYNKLMSGERDMPRESNAW